MSRAVVLVGMSIGIVVIILLCSLLYMEHRNYEILRSSYGNLISSFWQLSESQMEMARCELFMNNCSGLLSQYNTLKKQYNDLLSRYNVLKGEYESLRRGSNVTSTFDVTSAFESIDSFSGDCYFTLEYVDAYFPIVIPPDHKGEVTVRISAKSLSTSDPVPVTVKVEMMSPLNRTPECSAKFYSIWRSYQTIGEWDNKLYVDQSITLAPGYYYVHIRPYKWPVVANVQIITVILPTG